jgi:hypothetical protein
MCAARAAGSPRWEMMSRLSGASIVVKNCWKTLVPMMGPISTPKALATASTRNVSSA